MALRVTIIGRPDTPRYRGLAQLFSACTRVQMATIDPLAHPIGEMIDRRLSSEDGADAAAFLQALMNTPAQDYALIIKDTSVLSPGVAPAEVCGLLNEIMTEAIEGKGQAWDLFYLARWMDNCNDYERIRQLQPGQAARVTMQVKTHSPHGFQALIASPSGRRKILSGQPIAVVEDGPERFLPVLAPLGHHLNHFVVHGGLIAQAATPDPFQFDLSTDPTATERLQECAPPVPPVAYGTGLLESKAAPVRYASTHDLAPVRAEVKREVKDVVARVEQGAAKVRDVVEGAVARKKTEIVDNTGLWLLLGLGVLIVALVVASKRR